VSLTNNRSGKVKVSTLIVLVVIAGAVYWPATLSMMGGGLIGGYLGGRIARRVSAVALRRVVIAAGFVISGYYFWKIYF